MILAICTAPVPRLEQIAPWLPPGLAAVVHRGLERDPSARWSSVEELAAALAPFAGEGQAFTLAELEPVESSRVERAQTALSATTGAVSARVPTITQQPARTRRSLLLAIGAAVVMGAAAAVWFGRGLAAGPKVVPEPAASGSVTDATAAARVTVKIVPPEATVRVDGVERAVENGRIELEGVAGDSFEVTARHGQASRTARVVVTRSGNAEPPEIVLDTPIAPASGSPTERAVNRAPPVAPRTTATPTPKTSPSPPSPATAKTATGTATARPTRDTW